MFSRYGLCSTGFVLPGRDYNECLIKPQLLCVTINEPVIFLQRRTSRLAVRGRGMSFEWFGCVHSNNIASFDRSKMYTLSLMFAKQQYNNSNGDLVRSEQVVTGPGREFCLLRTSPVTRVYV